MRRSFRSSRRTRVSAYVFDTSALLRVYLGEDLEPEYDGVEADLEAEAAAYITTLVASEVYYILYRRLGQEVAEGKLRELKAKFTVVPIDIDLAHEMGKIKAVRKMSLADASTVALARRIGAMLVVGKDKEFEGVENIIRV